MVIASIELRPSRRGVEIINKKVIRREIVLYSSGTGIKDRPVIADFVYRLPSR